MSIKKNILILVLEADVYLCKILVNSTKKTKIIFCRKVLVKHEVPILWNLLSLKIQPFIQAFQPF